jgi:uncharacterized protein (DUF1778 family)
MKKYKTIGVQLDEAQNALIEVAAEAAGMGVSTFMRYLAIREAKVMQLHYQQPQAD